MAIERNTREKSHTQYQAVLVPEQEKAAWNDYIARVPFFSMLQSWEWGEFKKQLGWTPFRVAVKKGGEFAAAAQVFIKPLLFGATGFAYIPRGPVGDWLDAQVTDVLLSAIHRIARQHRVVFLKLEPPQVCKAGCEDILLRQGFKPGYYNNQPCSTIIVDLTRSLEEILGEMRSSTRRSIQAALRKGVTFKVGDESDIPAFFEMMQTTSRRAGFAIRGLDYYQHEWKTMSAAFPALFLLAYYQDILLAANISYSFGKHVAFFHQVSSGELRELNPNPLLVWETIKWAKGLGCESYDLWGIPDEIGPRYVLDGVLPPVDEKSNGLWGVYRFKSSISKNVVAYIGSYDYAYLPLLYLPMTSKYLTRELQDQAAAWLDNLRR